MYPLSPEGGAAIEREKRQKSRMKREMEMENILSLVFADVVFDNSRKTFQNQQQQYGTLIESIAFITAHLQKQDSRNTTPHDKNSKDRIVVSFAPAKQTLLHIYI